MGVWVAACTFKSTQYVPDRILNAFVYINSFLSPHKAYAVVSINIAIVQIKKQAQRSQITCARPHTQELVEWGFKARHSGTRVSASNQCVM